MAAIVTMALASLLGVGAGGVMVLAFTPLMVLGMVGVGRILARPVDQNWLPTLVVLGFLAKLAGSGARYYFVRYVYASGDAFGYYRVGMEFAEQWRAGHPPGLSGNRGEGTQAMEAIAGVVFTPFMPDMLGGFFLFAALSFFGQLALYAAFRRWGQPHQLKAFAVFILFLPTYVFWPSSIGKDAVMLFGLGIAAYCIARLLEAFETRWLLGLGAALAGIGFVRIHISALVVGALFLTALVAKPTVRKQGIGLRKAVVVGGILVIGFFSLSVFEQRFGANPLDTGEIDSFSESVVDRTSQGSVVPGGPVSSPADVPEAMVLVLFRPFPWEGGDLQVRMAGLETSFLLGLLAWKLPAMIRNRKRWRSNPLVVFSTFYVFAFCIAFSVIRNLGIIARQRTQVLAFLLMIIISLGWELKTGPRRLTGHISDTIDERQLALAEGRSGQALP
jgi:Dolichyl-phosphate-mannose-protein mannosyltransferase